LPSFWQLGIHAPLFGSVAIKYQLSSYNWVLIPENVIYFHHEEHEGLEDITALTSRMIL
jgi:hypothetical protein